MRPFLLIPLCCAVLCGAACPRSPVRPSIQDAPVCYRLDFPEGAPGIAPDRFELQNAAGDSGLARWLPSARQTPEVHVMVGALSGWRRQGDSLRMTFTNLRATSIIELRVEGDTLRGRVGGMSDGAIGLVDWKPAVAIPIECPASSGSGTSPVGATSTKAGFRPSPPR